MPATILTSLLLWSAFLLPGAEDVQTRDLPSSPAMGHSMMTIPVNQTTIQAWPLDESPSWTLSEANSEEEDSSDSDDNVITAERCWTLSRMGQQGPASTIRLDRGFACSPIRSTILRC
jgi:hypothetical protein